MESLWNIAAKLDLGRFGFCHCSYLKAVSNVTEIRIFLMSRYYGQLCHWQFIYPFIYFLNGLVGWQSWSESQHALGERWDTPWTDGQSVTELRNVTKNHPHIHTLGQFKVSTSTSLHVFRLRGNPHRHARNIQTLQVRLKPRTFFLWDNSANPWATVRWFWFSWSSIFQSLETPWMCVCWYFEVRMSHKPPPCPIEKP